MCVQPIEYNATITLTYFLKKSTSIHTAISTNTTAPAIITGSMPGQSTTNNTVHIIQGCISH